jgi:hypothetical protein
MQNGLTRAESAALRALRSPDRVQRFLDDQIAYNKEPDGATCRSVRRVLRDRVAHCVEGALLAAAALQLQGHRPMLVDLEAVRDDDHVIAVFRRGVAWGAVAKSNFAGLRFREPVYRSLRELVASYFEHYYNLEGEKTLRAYSRPLDLSRFGDGAWLTSEDDVWSVPETLCTLRHYRLLTKPMERSLSRMDARLFQAGMVGMRV